MIFIFIYFEIITINMFNVLKNIYDSDSNSDSDCDDDCDDNTYYNNDTSSEKFTSKEVDMLYSYFVDKGLVNEQVRCLPQNWRISKEHIYASLRRNDGDINKAGEDLSNLIENENFEIRTFYARLKYSELLASLEHPYYIKPYVSGQQWQIKPEIGMYLLNKNKVYKISHVSLKYGSITLDTVLTRDYNFKVFKFNDEQIRYGKYKQIDENQVQHYLEKEYKILCDECEKVSKDQAKWLSDQFKKRQKYQKIIEDIEIYHRNNCTMEAKLKIVGRFDLPISIIKKIIDYNIESKCKHHWEISDIQRTINYIDYNIEGGYQPYINISWKIQVAYHILRGDYEEWLNDY